jgi:hypothetical protein
VLAVHVLRVILMMIAMPNRYARRRDAAHRPDLQP